MDADQFTNQDYSSFDPALRIQVVPCKLEWLVFDKLQAPAEELYNELQTMKKVNAGN